MNTRIRYSKMTDDAFISMRVIVGEDGKEYRAYIKALGKEGYIHNLSTGDIHPVVAPSPHKLKIELKSLLMKLGCKFNEEARNVDKEDNT